MTTPSEGEAMLALAERIELIPTYNGRELGAPCRRIDQPVGSGRLKHEVVLIDAASRTLLTKALRAAAQSSGVRETYTEYCMNEKCPRGVGVPIEVVRLSPDTPREVVVPHEDCLNCRCLPHEMCEGRRVISPVKTEQLDQAQFGRVLHKRPDTPREGER